MYLKCPLQNTLLQRADKYKEELYKELKEERQLSSSFMKQKGKQVTTSEKDEIIESLTTKLGDEKKEEKKLRQELLEEIESLQHATITTLHYPSVRYVCVCVYW